MCMENLKTKLKEILDSNKTIFKEYLKFSLKVTSCEDEHLYSITFEGRDFPFNMKSYLEPSEGTVLIKEYLLELGLSEES